LRSLRAETIPPWPATNNTIVDASGVAVDVTGVPLTSNNGWAVVKPTKSVLIGGVPIAPLDLKLEPSVTPAPTRRDGESLQRQSLRGGAACQKKQPTHSTKHDNH
jgi:hypothetical protein